MTNSAPLRLTQPETDPTPPPGGGDELDFGAVIAQILARKWLILLIALTGAAIGAFVGQLAPDQYQAGSVVQIEKRSSGVTLPEELIGELLSGKSTDSSLETEVHIIRSRLILSPVVERLGLETVVQPAKAPVIGDMLMRRSVPILGSFIDRKYARRGESLTVDKLLVPETMLGKTFRITVLKDGAYSVALPDGTQMEGRAGTPLEMRDGMVLSVAAIEAPAGRVYEVRRAPLRAAIGQLRRGLEVSERKSTGIVDFRFTSVNRPEAVHVVNAVVDSYQEQNLQRRSAEIDQSITFIEQQLPEIRQTLDDATAALSNYRQGRQSAELSLGTQELLEQAVTIENALEELAFREEQLAQRLTPNHPDYRQLLAERERLLKRQDELRADLQNVPEAEQELARLTQRVERARTLETQLTARVEQLRILKASTVGNIRVLEPAEVAGRVGPDRTFPIIAAGGLAFLLAVAGVLLLNMTRRGVEDASAIEELGLSLFGTVNKVASMRGARSGDPIYSLALSDPQNIAVEALRGLRTGLQFSLAAAPSNSLMITSCAPSDGKSFISLNLATVYAKAGNRVLLIDADMRRGELRRHFGLKKNEPGLSDYLAAKAPLGDVVISDSETGLDFIGSGAYPPNPAELLAAPAFAELIQAACEHYEMVLVDAPPALAVTDPGIIGQHCGMSLLVVRHLVTSKPEILAAQKTLGTAGVRLSGVILNEFDQARSRYGQYGARYGYYYGGYRYKYD